MCALRCAEEQFLARIARTQRERKKEKVICRAFKYRIIHHNYTPYFLLCLCCNDSHQYKLHIVFVFELLSEVDAILFDSDSWFYIDRTWWSNEWRILIIQQVMQRSDIHIASSDFRLLEERDRQTILLRNENAMQTHTIQTMEEIFCVEEYK